VRREVDFTLECSGNHGFDNFIGAIGNARWGGTPLALLLEEAVVLANGTEVVFLGRRERQVDDPRQRGHPQRRKDGTIEPDAEGSLDLTMSEQFPRSMSLSEALSETTCSVTK
jgi:DMSO/TMAO reductase YedYZ molybdopterin-dependent catalytic subunit